MAGRGRIPETLTRQRLFVENQRLREAAMRLADVFAIYTKSHEFSDGCAESYAIKCHKKAIDPEETAAQVRYYESLERFVCTARKLRRELPDELVQALYELDKSRTTGG